MASVWVVEKGKYSDYKVVGVFSAPEHAQAMCDLLNVDIEESNRDYSLATAAEWPLDPWLTEISQGRQLWQVWMRTDGQSANAETLGSFEEDETFRFNEKWTGNQVYGCVWATSAEHAIKIVNEKRLLAIANAPPPEPPPPEPTDYERWRTMQDEINAKAAT